MEIHIGNRVADVELLGKDGNKVRLDIDGQPYEVDIVMAENGACSILHDGHSYNAELIRSGGGKNYQVNTFLLLFGRHNRFAGQISTYAQEQRREAGRQGCIADARKGHEDSCERRRPSVCRGYRGGARSHEDAEQL